MTYEDIIEGLDDGCEFFCNKAYEDCEEICPVARAKRALKAESKYAWHDLRKDHTDLPPRPQFGCKGYMVKQIDIEEPFSAYWNGTGFVDVDDEPMNNTIIAWSEIKPFEEGTKHEM